MAVAENQKQAKAGQEIKASFELVQDGQKRTLLVRKERVVIGTVESADIKLTDRNVSPIHAVLELQYGPSESQSSGRILDLASVSGVLVNGNKVINQILHHGDRIQIGQSEIIFGFRKPEFQKDIPDQALLLIEEGEIKEIFDYRPPVKDALEVVYSWNQTILDVKHFVTVDGSPEEVTLGDTTESDFLVPPVLTSGSHYTLAALSGNVAAGNKWTLHIDPKMSGALYIQGELISIQDYAKKHFGAEARGPVTLSDHDFAKVEAEGISFYLSQTVAPPVLRNQTELVTDPFLAKTLIISMVLTGIALVGISRIDTLPAEVVQVPEVIATILYHPEKYSQKRPQPKEEKKTEVKQEPESDKKPKAAEVDFTKPKEKEGKVAQTKSAQPGKKQAAQSASKEGAGARAKGEEGKRGVHNQLTATPKTAANRPSPEAGKDRGGTVSQVADNGNVQMLKGATNKILDLLGGSGEKLGKSGSKLSGFSGFSTEGNGGLAMEGHGKGGGGSADTLLGGIADKGRGGGKIGTGLGAEGTGSGIVGGKTRVELNMGGGEETVVVGAIDRDAVEAAIRAHRDEFRYCYEREVNAGHPNLAGKVVPTFVIGASGRGSQLAIASSSIGSATVERCVLGVLSRIQFPFPQGGVPVRITYPFAFAGPSK